MTHAERVERINETLEDRDMSRAELGRGIGYVTAGEYGYVGKILRGEAESPPMLARMETWLDLRVPTDAPAAAPAPAAEEVQA